MGSNHNRSQPTFFFSFLSKEGGETRETGEVSERATREDGVREGAGETGWCPFFSPAHTKQI